MLDMQYEAPRSGGGSMTSKPDEASREAEIEEALRAAEDYGSTCADPRYIEKHYATSIASALRAARERIEALEKRVQAQDKYISQEQSE